MPSPKSRSPSTSFEAVLINGCYEIQKKIGHGSFGDIYQAREIKSNILVAVKLEKRDGNHDPQLESEFEIYKKFKKQEGIPKIYWFGVEGDFNVLVMELLGSNLESLFNFCKRKFSLKTLILLADNLLRRLETIHNNNFVHRDIKPENIMVGRAPHDLHQIYLIDFGLAKTYRNPQTRQHGLYVDGKSLVGTARYASINAHMGIEISRRDDLEVLAMVLIYFARGSLPWQGLGARGRSRRYKRIMDKKLNTSVTELCKGLPKEFSTMLYYARALRFSEAPDYRYLRRMFQDLLSRKGLPFDYGFDWVPNRYFSDFCLNENGDRNCNCNFYYENYDENYGKNGYKNEKNEKNDYKNGGKNENNQKIYNKSHYYDYNSKNDGKNGNKNKNPNYYNYKNGVKNVDQNENQLIKQNNNNQNNELFYKNYGGGKKLEEIEIEENSRNSQNSQNSVNCEESSDVSLWAKDVTL